MGGCAPPGRRRSATRCDLCRANDAASDARSSHAASRENQEGRFWFLTEANRLVSQPDNVDFVNGILGAHVLKDAFVNLRISDEGDAAAGSAVASFLAVLKSRPNIFVDAW